ncbi:small membrane protein [Klebsiella pasteurii]|nr:small membrane protein [Klebsiella michiganensis]EMB9091228.1 small membrane protein [Klebsiella michiganensis]MBZ7505928.1 small membrane protein [Klebsiella michiganensis]HDT5146497.1 small membrane protein [Klebsiella michiganensis]
MTIILISIAIFLLLVSVGFLVSYISDRHRYKKAFKKKH